MNRWLSHPLARPLVVLITSAAMVATPFLLCWHFIRSKKISVSDGSLFVGKREVLAKDIEYLAVDALFPFPGFTLKCVGRRSWSVIPVRTADFYAWIKEKKVALRIEGTRKAEFQRLLGSNP